jgi:hypothetical protein
MVGVGKYVVTLLLASIRFALILLASMLFTSILLASIFLASSPLPHYNYTLVISVPVGSHPP